MIKETQTIDFVKALNEAYSAGFAASGEGYNAEYPFQDNGKNFETDTDWLERRDNAIQKIKEKQ